MNQVINRKKIFINIYFILISALLVILYLGTENIGFKSFSWLFYGDAGSDLVNWLNFKNSSWEFPIGNFNLGDLGTNSIAFTGAIPLFSILSKLLFKNLDNFHFFNIWIFLCFYLQYLFSFLLLNKYYQNYYFSILGGLFFVLSPILLNRIGIHLSLGAHWLILAYFYYKSSSIRNFNKIIFIICLSSLIHFYFTMMILLTDCLYNIFIGKIFRRNQIYIFLKFYIKMIICLIIVMYLIGYFSIPVQDTIGYGYGTYKLNLLSPINPSGYNFKGDFNWSSLMPLFDINYGEKEGFNYFGLGYLILLFFFITNLNLYSDNKIYYYAIIIIIISIFSLSNVISLGNVELIEIKLHKFIEAPLSIARASGRFFWIVYYFLLLCCLINIKNFFKQRYGYVLVFLLSLQIADLMPGYGQFLNGKAINKKDDKIQHDEIWNEIIKKNKILTSSYVKNQSSDFNKILPIITKKNLTSEIQYFARYDRDSLLTLRYKNYDDLINNRPNPEKVYLINNLGHANHIKNNLEKNLSHTIILVDEMFLFLEKKLILNFNQKNLFEYKIKSKLIEENVIYRPKFIDGNRKLSFLGLGWTKHGFDPSAISDGIYSSLFFDLSKLKNYDYILRIEVEGLIKKINHNLLIEINDFHKFNKNFSLNKNNKNMIIDIPLKLNQIKDKENYSLEFKTNGQITEFEILNSPDKKKLGFKINSIQIIKN